MSSGTRLCEDRAWTRTKSSQASGQSSKRWTVLSVLWDGGQAAEVLSDESPSPQNPTANCYDPSLPMSEPDECGSSPLVSSPSNWPSIPFWTCPKHIRPSLYYSPNLAFPEIFLQPYTLAKLTRYSWLFLTLRLGAPFAWKAHTCLSHS